MSRSIVIVEKSRIIREGLISLLRKSESGLRIVDMEDFDEWAVSLRGSVPDVVIFSPETAREGTEKIRSKYGLSRSVLLVGLVYQYYTVREVSEMFDEVIYITDSEDVLAHKFINLFKREIPESSASERLTDREKDVLILLLRGKSNKEVADQLSISPHTVVTHRKNIIEKTGIRSLSGLAVYAILNNIADMDDLKQ